MRFSTVTLLFLSLGCNVAPASGVWLLTLTPDEAGVDCTETLTQNFTYGYEVDSSVGSEWTTEESSTLAQELAFIEIIDTAKQEAVMVWDNEAWTGTWNTAYWEFSWSESTDQTQAQTHIAGYSYSESNAQTSEDLLDFTIVDDTASGELLTTSSSQLVWEESDLWSDTLALEIGETGSIPSYAYLVELVPGSKGETSVYNNYASAECDSDPCKIQLDNECTQLWSFTAIRAQTTTESGYGHLSGAGQ